MTAGLPEFLTEQTEEAILQRMLDRLPDDLDKSEGSYIWDALAPVAVELTQSALWAQEVLRRGFASTTYGEYLDLRCEESGVFRKQAVKAAGSILFAGTPGTVIPIGSLVATEGDAQTGESSMMFETTEAVTLDSNGVGNALIQAAEAGKEGNVSAGAIKLMATPVAGVTSVVNLAAIAGGLDAEEDESLLARYLQRVRMPSAGGNKADYINWALEMPGVGGVSVVPVRDGPGTVSVAVIDTDGQPATQELVDAVQEYIAPPWVNQIAATELTIGGFGASVDGDNVLMTYDAGGVGTVTDSALVGTLQQAGLWQIRLEMKVNDASETANLIEFGCWNATTNDWAATSSLGSTDAMQTLKAADLDTEFSQTIQPFYWNGIDQIELRVKRLQSDTATEVRINSVKYRSAFSRSTGEGKAPVGASVAVEAANAVPIHISASLSVIAGYEADGVKTAVEAAIGEYIRGLAFETDNDVRYVRIGQSVLDVPGVEDYTNLLVNGGTANVPIGIQEVAVSGTVTLL